MAWHNTKLENILKDKLCGQFGESKADEIYGDYISARKSLAEDILEEIKAKMPNLTDHGPKHIQNVLDNAYKLIIDEIDDVSGIEIYALCMSILFHDVGNLNGREKHNRNISKIYNHVRSDPNNYHKEHKLILDIAGAHCGKASDGTSDTLKDVNPILSLHGESVNAKKLAAILRFADELAEGPQRTSVFMQEIGAYADDSEIYHLYANCTDVHIDKARERIALTYNLNIGQADDQLCLIAGLNNECNKSITLQTMLEYIMLRIIKLDQERKFAKYYCDWLAQFKTTSISFDCWYKNEKMTINLKPLNISDLIVPGDNFKELSEIDSNYSVDHIIRELQSCLLRSD